MGGGVAGLSAAVKLHQAGRTVSVLEATDRVGGRMRSDQVDGFTLDHGFQVLNTAYPACQALLDFESLQLRMFEPGASVRVAGSFSPLSDPWRNPRDLWAVATSPVGTLFDKLRIATLRGRLRSARLDELYTHRQQSTAAYLKERRFSERMIERFFRPFLGGVFLDPTLDTPSRMFEFVFSMFAKGDVGVPAAGMQAIPQQLAAKLPTGCVQLQSTVAALEENSVRLTDDRKISASMIVLATESDAAARLLGQPSLRSEWNHAMTIYYAADQPPHAGKRLLLSGDEQGPVQTVAILSNIAPEYAPPGRALLAVNLQVDRAGLDDSLEKLDADARMQLQSWFGVSVGSWQTLRAYRIPFAVPRLSLEPVIQPVDASLVGASEGVYLCGDYRETASIQGAMNSGLRAAQAILTRAA